MESTATVNNTLTQAFINIHGQLGLTVTKQKQIEDLFRRNSINVLHCQEINIDEESFNQCSYLNSNYTILQNNALNRYGTATIVRKISRWTLLVGPSSAVLIIFL